VAGRQHITAFRTTTTTGLTPSQLEDIGGASKRNETKHETKGADLKIGIFLEKLIVVEFLLSSAPFCTL
jgi:hypothetical protein